MNLGKLWMKLIIEGREDFQNNTYRPASRLNIDAKSAKELGDWLNRPLSDGNKVNGLEVKILKFNYGRQIVIT